MVLIDYSRVNLRKIFLKSGKNFLKQNSVGSCSMSPKRYQKSPTLKYGKKPCDARLKFAVHAPQAQNANFAPDFLNTAKLPQWPNLYKSYEATYAQKRLLFEKIAENRFTNSRLAKNRFPIDRLTVSQLLEVVWT